MNVDEHVVRKVLFGRSLIKALPALEHQILQEIRARADGVIRVQDYVLTERPPGELRVEDAPVAAPDDSCSDGG